MKRGKERKDESSADFHELDDLNAPCAGPPRDPERNFGPMDLRLAGRPND